MRNEARKRKVEFDNDLRVKRKNNTIRKGLARRISLSAMEVNVTVSPFVGLGFVDGKCFTSKNI